ncbi:TPA: hypothetical protein R1698_001279 [Campylobacter lari]|uniref:hypothetical protein n=1 Tax=Campylobacter TaxID=194 RepID=UPI000E1312CE|nr:MULTISPECIES: hypothetical protein [Campylobacter]MCV3462476.1 hypothetical protein [Campylobacter sp. FU_497]SUX05544.1 Uncharacterised protein [Campylobacter lari]HEC1759663.1 hypothetical protein [Campylobacter lari]
MYDLPILVIQNLSGHILEGTIIIVFFFVLFLILLYKRKSLHKSATSLLITIGICFTFYGISKGLANFDANNIEENLPQLIDGIKTAFLVSVEAVFFAILLKIIALFLEKPFSDKENIEDDIGIEDVVALQKENLKINQENLSSFSQLLNAVKETNDNIKLLRMDNKQGFVDMKNSFENFSKTMAENNSKAFIQALEEVIKDFNNKITEQFGDNFKQLNLAVGALLSWQENYKSYIEKSESNMENLFSSLDKAIKDYSIVVDNSERFFNYTQSFENILKDILNQKIQMQNSIESLDKFLENIQNSTSSLIKEINDYKEQSLNIMENISKLSLNLEESYVKAGEKLIADMSEYVGKFSTELSNYNEKINTQLIEGLNNASTSINSQVKTLDQELENVLKNLGSNLASISSKFVDDYNSIISNLSSLNQKLGNLR